MLKKLKLLFAAIVFAFSSSLAAAESAPAAAQPSSRQYSTSEMKNAGGRVLILFMHPVVPGKLWAGTEHGGLWQSDDAGITWKQSGGVRQDATVAALAVDPLSTDTMYAGTGDGRSSDAARRGNGMYKSIDGGVSWTLLSLTDPANVGQNWSHISFIAISSAGVMLAATSDNQANGYIYRSLDGGTSWGIMPVYSGNKVGPRNRVHKVRFDPANPDTAIFMDDYANVTLSTDGGASWSISRKSTTCP